MDKETIYDAIGNIPGESRKARAALIDYAMMRRRSLLSLARMYKQEESPPTKHLKTLEVWSSKYHWQSRVAQLDKLVEDERVEKWLRRADELNESDWDVGEKVKQKAIGYLDQLIDSPSLISLANTLIAASKLQRLATGNPTETIELYGQSLIKAVEHELERLGYDNSSSSVQVSEEPTDT